MATPLDVCNLALARIGSRAPLTSLDEAAPEAFYCRMFFDQARDATLEAHAWRFATRHAALAISGTPPEQWAYQYALPADCIRVRGLVDPCASTLSPLNTAPIRFERGLGKDDYGNDFAALWTNQAGAVLVYTARVTNPGLWEPFFVAALSWQLATEIAVPLTGNGQIMAAMSQGYQNAIAAAMAATTNQAVVVDNHEADWLTVRGLADPWQAQPLLTQMP